MRPFDAGSIERRASFDLIRYANCWEDATVLADALELKSGDRCLSIASAGDNSFSLLASDVEEVVAVDVSSVQLALVELRAAAIGMLDDSELLAFLGIGPSTARAKTYRNLRGRLSQDARAYWDRHGEAIARGVIHTGKFESYFNLFRRSILPLMHSRNAIESLLSQKTIEDRRAFYARVWDNRRWRLIFRLFFGRRVMGRAGRDPEFFRYVKTDVGTFLLERGKYALTELDPRANPYLRYILTGNFTDCLPHYLQPQVLSRIRKRLDRLTIVRGTTDDALRLHGPFDAFNLSDIFEYMSPQVFQSCAEQLVKGSKPSARFAYWNLLVPRSLASVASSEIVRDVERSAMLHKRDFAFFYTSFHLDRRTS